MNSNCNVEGATARTHLSLMVNNFGEEGPGDIMPRTCEKARKELNETPERRIAAIAELKSMVARDEKFSQTINRTDDSFFLRYLRAKKFNVDRAFSLMQNHNAYPERIGQPLIYYRDLTPGQILAMEQGVVGFLPKRDKAGRKILCLFPGKWNTETMPLSEMHSLVFLTLNMLIESEETQVNGFVVLCDGSNLGYRQLLSVITNKDLMMHIVHLIQETFPGRFKEAIITNHPWYVSLIKTLVFPLIKKKFRDRIHFMGGNLANISENFGRECLPQEFNGSLPKYDPSFVTQAIHEAKCNFYPPFTSTPPEGALPGVGSVFTHKRHASDGVTPTTPPPFVPRLERSLSLHNLDEEYHDAINFPLSTPTN